MALLGVYDTFRELDRLRREFDRLFDSNGGRRGTNAWRSAFLPGRAARAYPLLNLSEDKETVIVEALAPGIDPASLDVTVTGDQLTISGEKQPLGDVRTEQFHRNERGAGRFVRTITLPAEIDERRVEADYRDGLLTITLPKAESAKPRQIAVRVA